MSLIELPFGLPGRVFRSPMPFGPNTIASAQAGHNIVVHCSAGIGRTGLFMAALAKQVLGLSGAEALQWIRSYIPHAVETPEQQRLLLDDE
jgi:protein-tyrosine phosphatase